MDKKLQELLDNCIGNPNELKEILEYLIKESETINSGFSLRDKKFHRLLTLLGAKGTLTEIDKNDILSQT